ncbi:MAG: FliI/YscN family ATPase, partial [candidate division Zixibacteria bacterium]|nr:FliI/YscN family ATPase [candidate division Zixibacteria bacterium]
PAVSVGRLCQVENYDDGAKIKVEVVGFRDDRILLMPLGSINGITPGAIVTSTFEQLRVPVGSQIIGRVLGGLGQPIDGKGPIIAESTRGIDAPPLAALERSRITEPLRTGIRVVDTTCMIGKGQRLGIFSGSGVGKSIMLGMMARGSSADINVVALIGERGREVRDFIERDLGSEGMKNTVVVAVTSDEPALIRVKGAMVATAIAEYFRDQGKDVMLLMDSITRVAMAQRQIGIAAGEPPTTKGYTPSVFALLPQLVERAGLSSRGSITGLYTVLVEGDDFNEPVSDAVRSMLDGHVSLSRKLASLNQYPAVDVLDSISRLMKEVANEEELRLVGEVRGLLSVYREAEDLINIGAYVKGSNPKIDRAISKIDDLNAFFQQGINELADHGESIRQLNEILGENKIDAS